MVEATRISGTPRKILLATDLSARCDRALDRSAALAATWGAELIAVNALEQSDDFYAETLDRRLPSWRRPPDAALLVEHQLRLDLAEAGAKVSAVVERGEPADVILRVAAARGCDLIVTGLARDETFGRYGLGSTVHALLRRSRLPLLVVKERARLPYGQIVVATDFSDASREGLHAAVNYFPDRRLTLLHAYDAPFARLTSNPGQFQDDYRQVVAKQGATFLDEAGLAPAHRSRLEVLLEPGDPGHVIRQLVRDRGVDLVVLGTHGRGALFEMLLGSVAKDILSYLACDALVVREPPDVAEGGPS
jgi:nucleotide-binding universal stress UspA family protein